MLLADQTDKRDKALRSAGAEAGGAERRVRLLCTDCCGPPDLMARLVGEQESSKQHVNFHSLESSLTHTHCIANQTVGCEGRQPDVKALQYSSYNSVKAQDQAPARWLLT